MADIHVTMACGCRLDLGRSDGAPHCVDHNEYRVQAVHAPPPRIRAVNCAASGPHVKES